MAWVGGGSRDAAYTVAVNTGATATDDDTAAWLVVLVHRRAEGHVLVLTPRAGEMLMILLLLLKAIL